jgi:serine/threonine protein phosphatase PrpC
MSTHSSKPKVRRSIGLFALSLLSGLLLTLQCALPTVAFASSPEQVSSPAHSQQGVLDLAGVSVVRLVVSYIAPTAHARGQCTGLGTLVGSWLPTQSTEKNNWVLSDSSLINLDKKACQLVGAQLTGVQILANATYTNSSATLVPLGQLQCQIQGQTESCADSAAGASQAVPEAVTVGAGGVLFSFHSNVPFVHPFLDVAQPGTGPRYGIELATNASTTGVWPATPRLGTSPLPQQYLDPRLISLAINNTPGSSKAGTPTPGGNGAGLTIPNEPGMPILNSDAQVIGMQLAGNTQLTAANIITLRNQEAELQLQHDNPLNTGWKNGIQQYEMGNYAGAQATLHQVDSANPQFQAALAFEQRAAAKVHSSTNGTPTSNGGNSQAAAGSPGFSGILLLIGIAGGVLLLIMLLILVSLLAGRRQRRRQELARFEAERVEAQRIAELEVQRQQQLQRSKTTANLQHPVNELPCPNCGYHVMMTDAFCPNCKYLLSPSASGLNLQATPPPSLVPRPQANYMQSQAVPTSSISELPTVEFSPGNGSIESEKTMPYSIQQLQGRNLSLVVGHRTDPGIKRKHKPNEDSLFAIQGARPNNSQHQQFGLFVVADGMGGHANGQDASRLAIQTIIDYILPRVSARSQFDDEGFLSLLREGVQFANQAVHQRNLDERADMGTTMTAALVVGATAYVANVGDSRTYLYREPEGLTRITHDHSVVASLVDAGIIKPDDIYTHPKRNQIYRSLGEKPFVEVDSFKVPLQPGDKLLLCSDGLWDMVRDPAIQQLMSAPAPNPSKTGQDLIQAALEGGGEDNVSVIVVSVTEATPETGITGIQLLAKPETVTVPDLPAI